MTIRPFLIVTLSLSTARPAAAQQRAIDFDALRDETVRVMSEYLRINTSNPPGKELETARWLKAFLAKEGIKGEILDTAELGPGRANFYARLRASGGSGAKRAIFMTVRFKESGDGSSIPGAR